MDDYGSIIIFIIGLICSAAPVILVIVLIVLLIRKNNPSTSSDQHGAAQLHGNNSSAFSFKILLKAYLYLIVSVSAFVILFGLTLLGKAAMGVINDNFSYGYDLSYNNYTDVDYNYQKTNIIPTTQKCSDPEATIIKSEGKSYCFKTTELKMDLINGASITISMLIIFMIHLFFLIRAEKDNHTSLLKKFFIFGNLTIYSVMSLIMLPIGIYSTLYYFILAKKPVASYQTPGGALSFAIFALIFWIIWLTIMLRQRKNKTLE